MADSKQNQVAISTFDHPDMRDRLKAIADREHTSVAQVVREILAGGIGARERQSVRNYGR